MGEEEVEKDIISMSPDIDMSGGNLGKNSNGQVTTRPSLSSSNSTEKVLPHYLRASTNSCHDFCKYGRKHEFEAKKRRPIRHKVARDAGNYIEGQDETKNVKSGERKKKSLVKLKGLPELKMELPDQPKIIKQKDSPSAKKVEVSNKPAIASKQRSVTTKSPSLSNQSGVPLGRSIVNSPTKSSAVPNGRRKSDDSPMSPGSLSGGNKSGRSRSLLNHSSGLSGGRNIGSLSSGPSGGSLTVRRNSEKKLPSSTGMSKGGQGKELKPPKASSNPKPSVIQVPSLKKALSYQSQKVVSRIMNQNRGKKAELSNQQTMEKTDYVIKPKPEDKSSEPVNHDEAINRESRSSLSLSSSCPSLSSDEEERAKEESQTELVEGDNTAYEKNKIGNKRDEDSKCEDKRRLRRSAMIHPEDKDCAPQKSRFQRGKVVSLNPENSTPMKLKFRPGRVVGQNQESDNSGPKRLKFRQGRVLGLSLSGKSLMGRQSFRRNRDSGDLDANATNARGPTVILKHQDVQGKKEEQGLFNEVIEVTANKLVETRKSKVKALVGAFETVISLQEGKPANTV